MWLGSAQQLAKLRLDEVPVLSSQVRVVDTARNFSVVAVSRLSMSEHVVAVCRGSYYQLQQLCSLKRCMKDEGIKTLMHVFIGRRLDCYNVLCWVITEVLLSHLQSDQNAPACLITGLRRREHITPVLRQLHWLQVRQHQMFKLASLGHRSIAWIALAYLSDECQITSSIGVLFLRSAQLSLQNFRVDCTLVNLLKSSSYAIMSCP